MILVLLFVIGFAIPFSTKLAVNAFRMAAVVWLLKLLLHRPKLRTQPLALPIFFFLVITAISSVLSYEPALSWGRMRTVSLLLLVPLITQTLSSTRQTRALALALLISTLGTVTYTGWQYTFGAGVAVKQVKPGSPLARAGVLPGDVVAQVNGKRVHSPSGFRELLEGPPNEKLTITIQRGAPPERYQPQFERAALVASGLTHKEALGRGHPVRAQGFFAHYVPFSELLMLMAALAFGLALRADSNKRGLVFAFAFAAIGFALLATATRATAASLAIACIFVLWMYKGWKIRIWSLVVLASMLILGSFWFQHTRGTGWYQNDPSSQYRQLMWRDGIRLIGQHPWFGTGMDSIYHHWQEWNIQAYQRFPNLKSHFHSAYIQVAVECGVAALLVWLWLLGSLIARLARYGWSHRSVLGCEEGLICGTLAGSIALCLTSLLHYSNGDAEFMISFWFMAGIAVSITALTPAEALPAINNK
jgi:hypothetical protein